MAIPFRLIILCNMELIVLAKESWGIKRLCLSCGAYFYDLNQQPSTCPKCGTLHDPEANLRSKKGRGSSAKANKKVENVQEVPEFLPDDSDIALPNLDEDTKDDELIEDTSDLGEEDDMGDVIDNVEEEEEQP
ncbi:MAG TPA: TIGR02300 family protein [Alphaproteobacteria bacterium]|nr:TIGR02300 family protein [Alphaproteobacteria bacterium]